MKEIVITMAFYGIFKDADTLRSWGLGETSTGLQIRIQAFEYLDSLKS